MPARRIRQLGDPILREISAPVEDPARESPLVDDLRATLHEFQRSHGFGRGISAVQIGELKRLIYIEFEGRAYVIFNPEYVAKSAETFRLWDDCFSFPDLLVYLERSAAVSVSYVDQNGEAQVIDAEGALSELLQHEIDHLNGVLAIDHAIGPLGLATRAEWERQRAS